ncbi:MAG: proline dehydrogenase family protein [Planctomycetes bacterium]|nr:proline dehydrogenase family protein [Planctomycetota bacterium]
MVRRFVAGEGLGDAVRVARELASRGMTVSLDPLGENVSTREEAEAATESVLSIVQAIRSAGVDSSVSIKLTQAGLDIGTEFCAANVRRMLEAAREAGVAIQIDMEGSDYTERTLAIYRELRPEHGNVGAVVQAYLRRTAADLAALCEIGGPIRLCKGAYREPAEVAFPEKAEVDANYVELAQMLLSAGARRRGVYPNIATHDERLIEWTKEHVRSEGIGKDEFEFQMLYGNRRDLQEKLAAEGYRMRVYVPFGREWYPYFMRRLAERPANVLFLVKNLLKY